jgi:hypothetical protein
MANPAKAQLTPGQGAAAIIAGVIGHFLFSIAWAGLLISIIFLAARSFFNALIQQFLDSSTLEGDAGSTITGFLQSIQGILNTLSIVFLVLNAIGIVFAFFISWLILRIGKVRKPGGATFSSFIIVAILDGGLLLLSLVIGSSIARNTDASSPLIIVWVVITAVVGALVWLWMVWVRRGPAPEGAAVAGAPAVATTADAPKLDAGAAPVAEAPVVDPAAPAAPEAVEAPAAPVKKPTTRKAPAAKPPAGTDES